MPERDMPPKHTPTPLDYFEHGKESIRGIFSDSPETFEMIVRAVNAYERHAKALMRIMAISGSTGGDKSLVKELKSIAEKALDSYDIQAISKAEGK